MGWGIVVGGREERERERERKVLEIILRILEDRWNEWINVINARVKRNAYETLFLINIKMFK